MRISSSQFSQIYFSFHIQAVDQYKQFTDFDFWLYAVVSCTVDFFSKFIFDIFLILASICRKYNISFCGIWTLALVEFLVHKGQESVWCADVKVHFVFEAFDESFLHSSHYEALESNWEKIYKQPSKINRKKIWSRTKLYNFKCFARKIKFYNLFLQQITRNMAADCSFFMKIVSSEYLQNMLCTQIIVSVLFWRHSEQFWYTTCSEDVESLESWKVDKQDMLLIEKCFCSQLYGTNLTYQYLARS